MLKKRDGIKVGIMGPYRAIFDSFKSLEELLPPDVTEIVCGGDEVGAYGKEYAQARGLKVTEIDTGPEVDINKMCKAMRRYCSIIYVLLLAERAKPEVFEKSWKFFGTKVVMYIVGRPNVREKN